MAVLLLTELELTDAWLAQVIVELEKCKPDLDLRVWPEYGNSEDIDIILAWYPPFGIIQQFTNLQLIISLGVGVKHILRDPDLPANIPIVRLVYDRLAGQMFEYIARAVLSFKGRFLEYQQLQRSREWKYLDIPNGRSFVVGILGLGALGAIVAQKLATLGLTVRGWSRTEKTIAGVECFHGDEQFPDFLSQCQIVVCLLPLTPVTTGILCHETFTALPQGAYLINVGRGEHLVEADLLKALDSGQIAGACLDVFQTEPLPQNHPFWSHPQVIVTPHIAAVSDPGDAADRIVEAIDRSRTGKSLHDVIDRDRGY